MIKRRTIPKFQNNCAAYELGFYELSICLLLQPQSDFNNLVVIKKE